MAHDPFALDGSDALGLFRARVRHKAPGKKRPLQLFLSSPGCLAWPPSLMRAFHSEQKRLYQAETR